MKASTPSTQPPNSRLVTKDKPIKYNHQYLIIFRTTKGRYINFSSSHDGIDWAIHNAYIQIELMLKEVMQDTVSWILVLSRLHNNINNPTIQNMLNNGINPLNHNCLQPVLEPAIYKPLGITERRNVGHGTKQISDITHLTHYTHDNKDYYDLNYGDNLTTAKTLQGNYFTFASERINLYSLDCVFNQINKLRIKNHLPNRRLDPIIKLFISHKDYQKHFDIVVNHLKSKPLQVNFDLVPPHKKLRNDDKIFSPCIPAKQAKNQSLNNTQAGKTSIQSLIFLLIICIFCLLFAYAIAYTCVLSKQIVSGTPNRDPLAFFMPNICLNSQNKQTNSIKYNSFLQGKTLKTKTIQSISYEGATLQNTKAIRQICKAVANNTESEPPHLIKHFLNSFYSVNLLTHNLLGGLKNA